MREGDGGEVRGGGEVVFVEGAWWGGGGGGGLGVRDVCVDCFLCCEPGLFVARADVPADPFGAEGAVPEGEEGLAEVGFDAPALVVHVVVAGVVACEVLEWVEWQGVAAVVVDGFEGAACEETHPLSCAQPCDLEGQASA